MDFSGVLSAVDGASIVLAITAIAAIKILPGVARWGYDKVITWFAGLDAKDNEALLQRQYDILEREQWDRDNNEGITEKDYAPRLKR